MVNKMTTNMFTETKIPIIKTNQYGNKQYFEADHNERNMRECQNRTGPSKIDKIKTREARRLQQTQILVLIVFKPSFTFVILVRGRNLGDKI